MAKGSRPRTRAVARPTAVAANGLRYVESSGLVAALLEGDVAARSSIRAAGPLVTSALTLAEAARAVVRARVTGRASAEQERAAIRGLRTFERRTAILQVTSEILDRAGRPFPMEPVRTLDAIHLATVESLGEPPQLVTIVTRDVRVRENARALGYALE